MNQLSQLTVCRLNMCICVFSISSRAAHNPINKSLALISRKEIKSREGFCGWNVKYLYHHHIRLKIFSTEVNNSSLLFLPRWLLIDSQWARYVLLIIRRRCGCCCRESSRINLMISQLHNSHKHLEMWVRNQEDLKLRQKQPRMMMMQSAVK